MCTSRELIIEYVMEKGSEEPLHRRISLYVALADICGRPEESQRLKKLATDLAEMDMRCREFVFQFKERMGGHWNENRENGAREF